MRALLLALVLAASGSALAQQKIVFGLVSPIAVAHAPLYFARELGWWDIDHASKHLDLRTLEATDLPVPAA
jgi:hypothetical protein